MAKVSDLNAENFPDLNWSENIEENLSQLKTYVTAKAEEAINWYFVKRKRKRFWGAFFRYSAIIMTAVAGIIPMTGSIFSNKGVPVIDPTWSTIFIAIAALLVALDKLGGFSSAWIRFVLASNSIKKELELFQFQWENEKIKTGDELSQKNILKLVALCSSFLEKINVIVEEETAKWAVEFRSSLKEFDPKHINPAKK